MPTHPAFTRLLRLRPCLGTLVLLDLPTHLHLQVVAVATPAVHLLDPDLEWEEGTELGSPAVTLCLLNQMTTSPS